MLIDSKFEMEYEIASLGKAVKNVSSKYELADSALSQDSDSVKLEGILGIDLIQFIDLNR
jgi:hypothetical protein